MSGSDRSRKPAGLLARLRRQSGVKDEANTVLYEPGTSDRRRLSSLRMWLSTIEESYFVTKNVVDHAVGLGERVTFGEKYLPRRLSRYKGQKRVAFLYHGYAQGRWAFERLERLLEAEPFDVFSISGGYQPYSQDIRLSAEYELRTLQYVLTQVDAEEVTLIGHSQGGLIVRTLLQRLGVAAVAPVTRAICLCTPHMGTWAAVAGTLHGVAAHLVSRLPGVRVKLEGESALQMIPGSAFLEDLNARPLPQGIQYTNLYNIIDPLVWPPQYARLPYPEATNVLFKKIGHLHALYDLQEMEVILRSILVRHDDPAEQARAILEAQPLLEERALKGEDTSFDEYVAGSD